jgi:CheY-like chemotaxis protein
MPDFHTNLLIVDDEVSTRTLLSRVFTDRGYAVRCAADGFSGLERIRESTPDVLLSDLQMPGMSGFEFLSVVRRRLPSIYVVAMSGAFSGEAVPQGVAADAFYEKASSLNSLLRIVAATIDAEDRRWPEVRASAPIWIAGNGNDAAGRQFVTIGCPECLRSFPHTLGQPASLVSEATCPYCRHAIPYAIVRSTVLSGARQEIGMLAEML